MHKNKGKNLILHLNIDFFKGRNIYFIYNMVYSHRSELDLSKETIIIRKFHFVKSYDEKTAENYRNCYLAEKPIVFKLSKISIPNFDSTNWKAE